MSQETTVNLIDRWRAGDEQAADELFRRYAQRLVELAQRRLSARLAARVAAEDIVQSAYSSFFTRARDGAYALEQTGDLWRLLATITIHKVERHRRRHRAGKRDVAREWHPADDSAGVSPELAGTDPPPEEVVAVFDTLEKVLDGLADWQRKAVEMRLQGYTLVEISEATDRAFLTIRRLMAKVKDMLESHSEAGGGG
jgi:RNA polymerase sigma-70 factor, ECF subfamily